MTADMQSPVETPRRAPAVPSEENGYLAPHVARLIESLRYWTGRHLVSPNVPIIEQARQLFHAPFAVLSHDSAQDPLLNYGNLAGLQLFEMSWAELTQTPSRQTAEATHQDERARLLGAVTRQGFVDDYRGVRVAKSGRRFMIEKATVWNLLDEAGAPCGQAARFSDWRFLDGQADR